MKQATARLLSAVAVLAWFSCLPAPGLAEDWVPLRNYVEGIRGNPQPRLALTQEIERRLAVLSRDFAKLEKRRRAMLAAGDADMPTVDREKQAKGLLAVLDRLDELDERLAELTTGVDTYLGTPVLRLVSISPLPTENPNDIPGSWVGRGNEIYSVKVANAPLTLRPGSTYKIRAEARKRKKWVEAHWCSRAGDVAEAEHEPLTIATRVSGGLTNVDDDIDPLQGRMLGRKIFGEPVCSYAPTRRHSGGRIEQAPFELEDQQSLTLALSIGPVGDAPGGSYRVSAGLNGTGRFVEKPPAGAVLSIAAPLADRQGNCPHNDAACAVVSITLGNDAVLDQTRVRLEYRQVLKGGSYLPKFARYSHPAGFDQPVVVGTLKKRLVLPDLTGKAASHSRKWLERNGLLVSLKSERPSPSPSQVGVAHRQQPTAGTSVDPGQVVTLIVYGPYRAPELPMIANMVGKPATDAKAELQAAGYAVTLKSIKPAPEKRLAFQVLNQDPAAGQRVKPGSKVTLGIYGPFKEAQAKVPGVVGNGYAQAKQLLARAGFKISVKAAGPAPDAARNGKVARQQPAAGQSTKKGSVVAVWVYSKPKRETGTISAGIAGGGGSDQPIRPVAAPPIARPWNAWPCLDLIAGTPLQRQRPYTAKVTKVQMGGNAYLACDGLGVPGGSFHIEMAFNWFEEPPAASSAQYFRKWPCSPQKERREVMSNGNHVIYYFNSPRDKAVLVKFSAYLNLQPGFRNHLETIRRAAEMVLRKIEPYAVSCSKPQASGQSAGRTGSAPLDPCPCRDAKGRYYGMLGQGCNVPENMKSRNCTR